MGWLLSGIVASALCLVVATALSGNEFCKHEPAKITAKVHQGDGRRDTRRKRQSGNYEPMRIHFSYDDTVNTMFDTVQRGRLQNTVIPAIGNFFESSLSVIRASSPIVLDRQCDGSGFFVPIGEVVECVDQCFEPSMCGPNVIPDDHLKRCVECNGDFATCATRPGSVDGLGVDNTDIIIYVSANCTGVPDGVLAFASACQLELNLDRPIAGYINFCPEPFAFLRDETNIRIGIHEVMHALAFSPGLYPWFRDENGDPRTARDGFGFPASAASTDTVRTMTYNDWSTRNGVVNHDVTVLVTPNVVEQARIHYNCTDIVGVELENQGGGGTASAHWEQRVMGNEGMTGFLLFAIPFSRITFGLLQDSGWYLPDYTMADDLAWGLNTGCTIPHGSCREYIEQQQSNGRSISPYCDSLNDNTRGCTVDHQFISACNLENISSIPSEFQYFDASPNHGGTLESSDFCPLELPIQASRCTNPSNQPATNNAGQLYGATSRCFELGRDWTRTDGGVSGSSTNNAGCYEYVCTSSGVEIILEGVSFLCSCEGEEILVDITVNDVRYQGSYICPSCTSVCYDSEQSSCLHSEPSPCFGQITVPDPCASNPCDVNAMCMRTPDNSTNFTCTCLASYTGDGFVCSGMMFGDDPHFSVVLPSNNLLCFSIMGEHHLSYNLISNNKLQMNAVFSPDSKRDEVTWIGSLGIIVNTSHANKTEQTKLKFSANPPAISINNKANLLPQNIDKIVFKNDRLFVSNSPPVKGFRYPSVFVRLANAGISFTVKFMKEHLDMFWHSTAQQHKDSHGLIGQFFRQGVDIDEVRKFLIIPGKEPVPVMRRPVWAFMEREKKDDQLCWTAMNPGYQGKGLIDGVHSDYIVDDVLADRFTFKKAIGLTQD